MRQTVPAPPTARLAPPVGRWLWLVLLLVWASLVPFEAMK